LLGDADYGASQGHGALVIFCELLQDGARRQVCAPNRAEILGARATRGVLLTRARWQDLRALKVAKDSGMEIPLRWRSSSTRASGEVHFQQNSS